MMRLTALAVTLVSAMWCTASLLAAASDSLVPRPSSSLHATVLSPESQSLAKSAKDGTVKNDSAQAIVIQHPTVPGSPDGGGGCRQGTYICTTDSSCHVNVTSSVNNVEDDLGFTAGSGCGWEYCWMLVCDCGNPIAKDTCGD